MKELTENLKIKAKKLFGVASWIFALILLISTVRNINNVRRIRSDVEAERLKVEKMKEENGQLAAQIAQTQGSAFIEQQIRDKLGLTKPGEAIVVLPDEDIIRASAPEAPVEEDTLPDPNWRKWEKLFL